MTETTGFYTSHDGLRLFYRDFGSDNGGTPVICLPGLTRNSRDFEDVARRLGRHRRVLAPDFRGRGFSDYDPEWRNYHPATYVQDVKTLLDTLAIDKVIVIGTSLGALCSMAMAATYGERLAGVIMNDAGPEINPVGLERVKQYAGRTPAVDSWEEAVAQTKLIYGDKLPGLSDDEWLRITKRGYREFDDLVPRLDHDRMIGEAVRRVGARSADPWLFFDALRDTPTTLIWGVLSDILTADIVEKMQQRKPDLVVVEVPNRGHVPLLDEPECTAAIDEMMAGVP